MAKLSAEIPSAQSAIQATEAFFAPALKDRDSNHHVVQKLAAPQAPNDQLRVELLQQAGSLLHSLHSAVKFEQTSQPQGQAHDSTLLLALYKLTDFLLLEGIYPALPPEIGHLSQLRAKSLFYSKNDSNYTSSSGRDQSEVVLSDVLDSILKDVDAGIEPLIRHRGLNHIIAGNAWLAHRRGHSTFLVSFSSYLDRLPTSTLFATYTSLLQTSKVEWFRSIISEQLSKLPLRLNGVRSTIDFIAASHRPPQQQPDQDVTKPSSGPTLPLEALQQASRLLSAVPRTMSADSYFEQIAPQLLALLDDRAEPELQKVSAFIIGNGVLGKRSIGAPGTVGWNLFAEPMLQAINPISIANSNKRKATSIADSAINSTIVSQSSLDLSLRRLSTLVLSHPSPSLTGRLIRPLLLPLWALSKYKGFSFSATETSKTSFALISQFLNLVGTPQNLFFLTDHLLWDGTTDWKLGPGEFGGVAIQKRESTIQQRSSTANLENELARIDSAVQHFCRLILSSRTSDADLSTLFHHVLTQYTNRAKDYSSDLVANDDILRMPTFANLLEALMTSFADNLMRKPDQVLDLIDRVLQQHIEKQQHTQPGVALSSLTALSSIIQPVTTDQSPSYEAESIHEDTLAIVLSLLNVLSVRTDFLHDSTTIARLRDIYAQLNTIFRSKANNDALTAQLQSTMALLQTRISPGSSSLPAITAESALDVQRTLELIAVDIASELPPIRRSALHALQALVKSQDAPLDVPSVNLILLEVLRTEKEEFVYLAAVQAIVQLGVRRNLGFVTRSLMDMFQDVDERTGVDGRLRIGEALASTAEEASELGSRDMNRGKAFRDMAQSLLAVAGRRGQRKKELLERQRDERLQRRKRKEAERAWGGEVPEVPVPEDDKEIDGLSPAEKELRFRDLETIELIVKGWEDTGYEEDVRIRASALSILGRLFEKSAPDLDNTTFVNTIDICLSVLSLELELTKAILRRAAALVVFGILKGIDTQLELGKVNGMQGTMDGEKWTKIEKVFEWVMDTDPDDLVVGHSQAILEGLEAIRMKIVAATAAGASRGLDTEAKLEGISVRVNGHSEETSSTVTKRPLIIQELD